MKLSLRLSICNPIPTLLITINKVRTINPSLILNKILNIASRAQTTLKYTEQTS